MATAPRVMFAGGGTDGHLFPGIAVAAHLVERLPDVGITFAGPGAPRERHAVRAAGYDYLTIPSQPSPQNPLQAIRFVTDNMAGYCAARWMLREQQVSLVVGMGGYTSTAVVRAAAARGVPLVLLEQNAVPSRTTRWLSRSSTLVCAAFDEVRPHLHVQAPVTVTGNPARPEFEAFYENYCSHTQKSPARKRMVVLGGAGGARSLNESMPRALQQLGDSLANWQIVHQTGEGQLQETERRYRQAGVEALAVTFIDQIASVLFASDLVVCRSGGTTLAELALASIPAVLVPDPHASDNHQLANAKVFAAASACRWIDESSQIGALDQALARELSPLITDEELLRERGDSMRKMARPDASAEIAAAICDTLYHEHATQMAA